MPTYIQKSQADGEHILHEADIAWPYHVISWLALIFLGVLIIGIVIFVRMQIWLHTTEFGLTDRKIIYKVGFFSRETHEIPLTSLDEVTVEQGFWGWLFGYGQLRLWGSGRGELCSPPVMNPILIRQKMSDARAEIIRPEMPSEHVSKAKVSRRQYRLRSHIPAHIAQNH